MNSTKKLKIVHTEASCGWGGQEIRILSETDGMLAKGHNVTVVCVEHSPLHRESLARGIPVVGLPIGKKRLPGLLAMYSWLKKNQPDVVNTHSSTDSWLVALSSLFLLRAPAIVRTRHISAPINNKWTTRWLYQRATDWIVTTGVKLRDTLVQDNGYQPDRITSVATGIDPAIFYPKNKEATRSALGLSTSARYLGIVATLRTWKGHIYLIEALKNLPEDVVLLIVGDGPNKVNIEKSVQENKLEHRVQFIGQQKNVADWLNAIDMLVLPSYANEGVPQTLMQGMLCKTPIVTTDVGSIPEIIQNEKTGLVVEPKNSSQLGLAISRLLTSPDEATTFATHAYKHAVAFYTKDKMIEQMEQIFQRVSLENQR